MRWDGQPAYHTFWPSSKHGIFPVRPHCTNARWNRWQEDSFYFGELEEITGTLSYCEWTVSSRTSNPITSPLGWSKKIWYAIKTKAPPIFFTLCTRTTVVKFQNDTATIKLCSITPHNLTLGLFCRMFVKKTRKPCCRKETARCRKCSFPLNVANNID